MSDTTDILNLEVKTLDSNDWSMINGGIKLSQELFVHFNGGATVQLFTKVTRNGDIFKRVLEDGVFICDWVHCGSIED